MPVARTRELTVVFAAAGIITIGTVTAALVLPPAADDLPRGSSFSHAPSGAAAAYLMLRAIGYDVRRSFEPIATFTEPPLSTVLVVADPVEAASTQDRRTVQTFLAAGGTV